MSRPVQAPRKVPSVPLFHLPRSVSQKFHESDAESFYSTVTTLHIQDTAKPGYEAASVKTVAVISAGESTENSTRSQRQEKSRLGQRAANVVRAEPSNDSIAPARCSSRSSIRLREPRRQALTIPKRTSSKHQPAPCRNEEQKKRDLVALHQRSCQLFTSLDSTLALSQSRSTSALSEMLAQPGVRLTQMQPDSRPETPPRATSAASHRSNVSYSLFPRANTSPPRPPLHSSPSSTHLRQSSNTSSRVMSPVDHILQERKASLESSSSSMRKFWRSIVPGGLRRSLRSSGSVRRLRPEPPLEKSGAQASGLETSDTRPRSSWSCMGF